MILTLWYLKKTIENDQNSLHCVFPKIPFDQRHVWSSHHHASNSNGSESNFSWCSYRSCCMAGFNSDYFQFILNSEQCQLHHSAVPLAWARSCMLLFRPFFNRLKIAGTVEEAPFRRRNHLRPCPRSSHCRAPEEADAREARRKINRTDSSQMLGMWRRPRLARRSAGRSPKVLSTATFSSILFMSALSSSICSRRSNRMARKGDELATQLTALPIAGNQVSAEDSDLEDESIDED